MNGRKLVRKRTAGSAGRGASGVGVKYLAGHVAGVVASEEEEARSDLIGLARTAHRRVLAEIRNFLLGLAARRVERSPDGARRNRVHANSVLHQILRERAREADDRALGRTV